MTEEERRERDARNERLRMMGQFAGVLLSMLVAGCGIGIAVAALILSGGR